MVRLVEYLGIFKGLLSLIINKLPIHLYFIASNYL